MGLGTLVNDITGGGLGLLDYHRAGDAADTDLTLVIGGVEAIDRMSFGKEFEEARKASNFNGLRLDGSRQVKQ